MGGEDHPILTWVHFTPVPSQYPWTLVQHFSFHFEYNVWNLIFWFTSLPRWKGPWNHTYYAWAQWSLWFLAQTRQFLAQYARPHRWEMNDDGVCALHQRCSRPLFCSLFVAQQLKASYHAGLSYLDASFIVNLLLTRRAWVVLGVKEITVQQHTRYSKFHAQPCVITLGDLST